MSENSSRYTGDFDLGRRPVRRSGGASAPPTPTPPPEPPRPRANDPFDEPRPWPSDETLQQEPSRHTLAKVIIGAIIVVAIGLLIWKVGPAIASHFSGGENPGPATSQTGSDNPGTSQQPSNTPTPSTPDNTEPTRAEEAVALDAWFSGIPEETWETKTAADLGGSAAMPIRQFYNGDYCIILKDGTVVTRGTTESGEKVPVIISDYAVPSEWYGKGLFLDRQNTGIVMVVAQIPSDSNVGIKGAVWEWDQTSGAYAFIGNGTSNPY